MGNLMKIKKILSLIAGLHMSLLAGVAGCLLYFSFLQGTPVNLSGDGFVATLTKEAKFFKALGYMESSSEYTKVNKFGYLGKYQFGEETLASLGYYIKDGSKRNDWKGEWTGKHGITSKEDFIKSQFAQEAAIHALTASNWDLAKGYKLDRFIGKKLHGVTITREGILAAMHLKGPKSVQDFIFHGVDSTDALGTGVKKYMNLFSDSDKLISA